MNYLISRDELEELCRYAFTEGCASYEELCKPFVQHTVREFLENKQEIISTTDSTVDDRDLFQGLL